MSASIPFPTDDEITAYLAETLCGELREIRDGQDNWIITCTQTPNHEGPHAGLIMWGCSSRCIPERGLHCEHD